MRVVLSDGSVIPADLVVVGTGVEERTRIARELHYIVAHHMSVVAIQAEAARYRVPDPPPELLDTLSAIRRSASAALIEMRMMLGVLRDADDATAPQPTLHDVTDLVGGLRAAGTDAHLTVVGDQQPLPAGGGGVGVSDRAGGAQQRRAPCAGHEHRRPTRLLRRPPRRGDRNGAPASPPASSGTGHGLLGMRERVALHRGELDAGPTVEGGYAGPCRAAGAPVIRVVVADDQALVREGIVVLLGAQPDLEVAGEAADGADAVQVATATDPTSC